MDAWQAELVAQIAIAVDDHKAARLSLRKLVEDVRGLFDAADISENEIRFEFEAVWAPVSGELELRTKDWIKPECVSEESLETVLGDLRAWAARRGGGADPQ
jgi:hypothetical protein